MAEDARRKKVLELRRDGFEVLSDEQASELVGGRVEAVPDLIARRGDEVVIVEFAQRQPDSALPDEVKDSLAFSPPFPNPGKIGGLKWCGLGRIRQFQKSGL
ncbi:hypothetical protein [Streptomyces sp. st140]|uniref:hypothetical protein n=1 Tax=Streptomyces sp. st140 TaxID=1828052 RepID=UPI0015CF416A|nr:hypothetical protein [Streptomyces sp. st140]